MQLSLILLHTFKDVRVRDTIHQVGSSVTSSERRAKTKTHGVTSKQSNNKNQRYKWLSTILQLFFSSAIFSSAVFHMWDLISHIHNNYCLYNKHLIAHKNLY